MKTQRITVYSIVTGILLGIIDSKFLFVGSALSLIPWTVAGIIIGYFSSDQKNSLVNGFLYGFFLSFFFMWAGYSGSASAISRVPFFAALGGFGGVCGLILGLIGFYIKKLQKK